MNASPIPHAEAAVAIVPRPFRPAVNRWRRVLRRFLPPEDPDFVWQGRLGVEWARRNAQPPEPETAAAVRSALGPTFVGRVLDAGSSWGRWSVEFPDYVGLDLSADALRLGRVRAGNLRLLRGVGDALPFRDRTFGAVFTHGMMMYLSPDRARRATEEFRRVATELVVHVEYGGREPHHFLHAGNRARCHHHDYPMLHAVPGWHPSFKSVVQGPEGHPLVLQSFRRDAVHRQS